MLRSIGAAFAAIPVSLLLSTAAWAGPVHANVTTFTMPDGSPAAGEVVGQGTLHRSQDGVNLKIDTTGLTPGNAYTIWWIVFNNPSACVAGCDGADLGTAEVNASVLNATGGVADDAGNGSFHAFLPVGFIHSNPADETSDGAFNRHLFGPGLQNLKGAEIHAVVRSHGPANGEVKQISTINGFCLDPTVPGTGCFDPQAVAFSVPGN